MKRRPLPESRVEHPNVVPLIDVMLCIIVFYMLAARIGVDSGADKLITVPTTALGTELDKIGTNNVVVNVRENAGEPTVTARVENGQGVQTLAVGRTAANGTNASLREVLHALIVGRDGKVGTADDRPELGVIVRGDGEMTYKSFMPVMVAITDAGVKHIFHNTKKEEGSGARGQGPANTLP